MGLSDADRVFLEGTTPVYRATIQDEAGEPIAAADLDTLELTLVDHLTGATINGRCEQDVLNDNNVTLDAEGQLKWQLQAADNAILGDLRPGQKERHQFLFRWTWTPPGGGSRAGAHKGFFDVERTIECDDD
jgi:hypothetical protein